LSIQNHDIAHVLRCIIGQRLVRSLCQHCRIKVPADETTINRVKAIVDQFPLYSFEDIHLIEKAAASSGIGGSEGLVTTNNKIQSIWEPNPEGCDSCHETGFAGLTGIFEVMQMTAALKQSVVKSADTQDITSNAIEEGMIPFAIDGLIKAFRGITTLDEIERAQQSAY
jgi:type II secretory ATPase GspE/PulE/Tfp pilus assembly ATPase PilB-like protein